MNKKAGLVFKFFFVFCVVSFVTFYVSFKSGYYEYNSRRKMTFTREQIERFESDVSSGNYVDINDYLINTDKDYQNKISRVTLGVSEIISKYTKKCINIVFSKISRLVEES